MESFSKGVMKIVGVIPARGGSKGVVRKNLALVAGKPLIAWSILVAKQCTYLDRVILDTDDQEIADIGKAYGAEVPFLRPPALAQDDSPIMDTLNHLLDFLLSEGYDSTHIMQLNPTSPLRTVEHLNEAVEVLVREKADSVVSVVESHDHPYWCKTVSNHNELEDFLPQGPDTFKLRQQLPPVYSLNGSIFLVSNELIREGSYYSEYTKPLIMTPDYSVDIDTPWDLYLANLILTDRTES